MDSLSRPLPSDVEDPAVVLGTLVVQTGRFHGLRRNLTAPLTLVGQSPGCEVRLHGRQVAPLHCAIIHGPDGFSLRDLGSLDGTFLNNEQVLQSPLKHGDVIRVGLFELRLEVPCPDEPLPSRASLLAGRDALRVQVAAVAAQQAQLAEEEQQLHEQRTALRRQRDQLADHLDDRRRQLQGMQAQVRGERKAVEAEKEAVRQQRELAQTGLAQIRAETVQEKERVVQERQRLGELRRRLRRRWQRHWQHQEDDLCRREQELAAGRARLERLQGELQQERARHIHDQLRFNGELEVGRRQLQEEWQRLGVAQQQWEVCINQEQGERQRRQRELERREAEVAAAEHALVAHRQQGEQLQVRMRRELQGLEVRIRNQREKLVEQETQIAALGATLRSAAPRNEEPEPPAPPVRSLVPVVQQPPPSDGMIWLTGLLADQRRHLLEQWARMLVVHDAWQRERAGLVAELESSAREVVQRQHQLAEQQHRLQLREAELGQRQAMLAEVRGALESWQARLTAREASWEGERATLLAQAQAREEQAQAQMQRLEEMHQQRLQRWNEGMEAMRQSRDQHEELRRDCLVLWQECQERRKALDQEQRDLAARALSLEQLRQLLLARAGDGPASERKLRRLERRGRARLQAQERDLTRQQQRLQAEVRRLDERAHLLNEREQAQVRQLQQLSEQQVAWQEQRETAVSREQQLLRDLELLRLCHEQDERQLARMREELERVAQAFLEDNALPAPSSRAA
jgi:pSer/pThr/pTyr-binding forkhead associated (FHA) protein